MSIRFRPQRLRLNQRRNPRSGQNQSKPIPFEIKLLGAALALGAIVGVGSTESGPKIVTSAMSQIAVDAGLLRARSPQAGDYWGGCDSARAAGTAPIYRGEPGYREEMDGDGDGVACEPYHGN